MNIKESTTLKRKQSFSDLIETVCVLIFIFFSIVTLVETKSWINISGGSTINLSKPIQDQQRDIIKKTAKELMDKKSIDNFGIDIINIDTNLYKVILCFKVFDKNMIRYNLESLICEFTFDEYHQCTIKSIKYLDR